MNPDMNYKNIPTELREKSNWVLWNYKERNGKKTKVPINPNTGGMASSADPNTWTNFDNAVSRKNRYAGIGFVFDGTGEIGIDLDKCRDPETETIEPWALEIIQDLDSYTEVSPSGTGVHIILKGRLPSGGNRKGKIEMYDNARYFCMTGDHLDISPKTVEARQSELNALHKSIFGVKTDKSRAKGGEPSPSRSPVKSDDELLAEARHTSQCEKFEKLFDKGDWEGLGYNSQSEADMALCGMLRSNGANSEQIDRMYRSSGLMRDKWDSKRGSSTYGAQLIEKIFEEEKHGGSSNLLSYRCNDAGNVERLIAMHSQNLRYCHQMKKWLCWDGMHWAPDRTKYANYLAKCMFSEYLNQAIREGNDIHEKFAKSCLDVKRINSVLEMAQADPRLIIDASDLDRHQYFLNFQNGTLDLRAGELHPHFRGDYLTQILDYEYDPDAVCPEWLEFLNTIMDNNAEMTNWLQKAIGYSLTGRTTEKKLYICYGGGNNGKTTFLDVKRQILGPYAGKLQISSLMSQRNKTSNHAQPDQASLRSIRDVMTSETDEDRQLDEQEVKLLSQGTGKATYRARHLYEEYIEFPETWTIWMDANHRPEVRGRDDAIWNRLCLIPFTITIPNQMIDRHLSEKLMKEAPGILAWMVKGAVQWCKLETTKVGLGKPPEIEEAGQEWRNESDHFMDFIEEFCVFDPHAEAITSTLRSKYQYWCEAEGYFPLGGKKYGARLRELGCVPSKDQKGDRVWKGVKLIDSQFDK